ncbi:MAG: FG-GAP-like repeat-containing protein [Kofleriaceae bacterium]
MKTQEWISTTSRDHARDAGRCTTLVVLCIGLVGCVATEDEPELALDEESSEISGGTNDSSDADADATVKVGGCTGTLIRPDVVLTAGHCIGGREQPPACAPITQDWQVAGQWYPFAPCGGNPVVRFGNDAAGLRSTASTIGANETFRIDRLGSTAPLESGNAISLRTANNFFVVAEGGGGQYVGADRTAVGAWEMFNIQLLLDSGPISDGAIVVLRAADGQVVHRGADGGLVAKTTSTASTAWWHVRRIAGAGAVADNDQIALQAYTGGTYWTAVNGGGGGWKLVSTASQYSIPVDRDIIMLKLTAPVPATIAKPVELVHRMPGRSFGTSSRWNDWFCIGNEICETGDFDGDGRDDVITFLRGTAGHVYVGRSIGSTFSSSLWATGACTGNQQCRVGDFNGDGRDDILALDLATGSATLRVSTGSGFGAPIAYGSNVCFTGEICQVGDVDKDRYADVIVFFRSLYGGTSVGDVHVARNRGLGLDPIVKWHDNLCVATEECRVGDFNGDNRTDIATFLRSSTAGPGDVFVALSTGTSFATRTRWHDYFCVGSEVCGVGDFNGDGTDDIVTYLRGTSGDVYVGVSNGGGFGPGTIWHQSFCRGAEECRAGDFDGDGRADIASFVRDAQTDGRRGDVNISRAVAPASIDAFLSGQTFKIAGWGWIDSVTRELPSTRQVGMVAYDRYGSWYDALHAIVVTPVGGSISQQGDSGGPLLWFDAHKGRYVNLGATQSVQVGVSAAYTIAFRPGGHLDAWVRKALDIR